MSSKQSENLIDFAAISVHEVTKRFQGYDFQELSFRDLFIKSIGQAAIQARPEVFALRDISFSISAGETWSLIGPNGAGKSTLLRLLAGIYRPSTGRIKTRGRLAALIELGVGFHPDLTGRENIFLYGNMLGMKNAELHRLFPDMVEFSGVRDFINTPVKYYSSGMRMRLGFSVATAVKPEILLLDEVFAVGDAEFYARCLERIKAFQNHGCTLVIATHDLTMAHTLASKCIWIDSGCIRLQGPAKTVIEAYQRYLTDSSGGLA
jgi:ABC-type polysaccharide/polyol phosphate transport system ATPase subunit